MPSLLARASRVAGRVSAYAVVPFALSLLAADKALAAADAGSVGLNVKFALPADVATLWTVVDPPGAGVLGVLVAAAVLAYPSLVGAAAATIVVDDAADAVASRGA